MVQDKPKPTFFFFLYMIRLFFKTIANTTENACITQLNTLMSNVDFFSLGKIMQYWRTFFECYCVAMQRKEEKKKREGKRRRRKKAIPPKSTKTDRSTGRQHYKATKKELTGFTVGFVFMLRICQGERWVGPAWQAGAAAWLDPPAPQSHGMLWGHHCFILSIGVWPCTDRVTSVGEPHFRTKCQSSSSCWFTNA